MSCEICIPPFSGKMFPLRRMGCYNFSGVKNAAAVHAPESGAGRYDDGGITF